MKEQPWLDPYPGDLDDPWAVWQAKKIVWQRTHFQENVLDDLETLLLRERNLKRVDQIGYFIEDIIKQHPWAVLIYRKEFYPHQQIFLKELAPSLYLDEPFKPGQWRFFIQTLLKCGLPDRIPLLKESVDELFKGAELEPPSDGHIRAVNNLYYAEYDRIEYDDTRLNSIAREFRRAQRKQLQEILGLPTVKKLKVLLDFRCWVVAGNTYKTQQKMTQELISQPLPKALEQARRTYFSDRSEQNLSKLEVLAAQVGIDLLFPIN